MNFLICIGGEKFSEPTIQLGGRLAKIFDASISVLYVSPQTSQSIRSELWMSRAKLSEWEIELPGIKVLRYARQILWDMGLVKTTEEGKVAEKHSLKPDIKGAYELHLFGKHGHDVRLRIREGEIVDQIKQEVELAKYDIAIVGASKKRRIVHHIIQFVDSSLLIVKNIQNIKYKFLITADDSPTARGVEFIGSRIAKHFDAEATVLAVTEDEKDLSKAEKWAKRASGILERSGVQHNVIVKIGDVIDTIVKTASDDYVIIMGSSRKSEWKKFIFGSKPIKVVQNANCPVLVLKMPSVGK